MKRITGLLVATGCVLGLMLNGEANARSVDKINIQASTSGMTIAEQYKQQCEAYFEGRSNV